jgi:hypothetical protein
MLDIPLSLAKIGESTEVVCHPTLIDNIENQDIEELRKQSGILDDA